MSGIPVVIAENGYGTPVNPVEANAPVMTIAENGYGLPIVLTALGAPFIVQGADAPFSPADLFANGEQGAWFAPSPATCFTDLAGTTPAAAGQPVARMNDLSGNGNHAVQEVAAARPILRQSATGEYSLEYDGVDDVLHTNVIYDMFGLPFLACAGVQALGLEGAPTLRRFLGGGSTGNVSGLVARLSGGDVGFAGVEVRARAGALTSINSPSRLSDLLPHVITGTYQSGSVTLRVDGIEEAAVARTIEDTFDSTLAVGHPALNLNFYGGVYVASNTITQRQIEGVEAYIASLTPEVSP